MLFTNAFIAAVCACMILQSAADDALLPLFDPDNHGRWQLNREISDEFEGAQLDESKWLIQGRDGVYRSRFIGRAPSQFSTDNVRLEDGMLKLRTRWDPDFDYSQKIDYSDKNKPDGRRYENITTAAVISKQRFLYGYAEIRCKAANASVSSAFWMTGERAELDVFEFLARPAQTHKTHLPTEFWSSVHDWSKQGGPITWTDKLQLDWRVGDEFHVYGVEWAPNYMKFHADGKEIRSVTRQEIGEDAWVLDGPMCVWVDSETFPWHGIPSEGDLPQDYEIHYIRVWQKRGHHDEVSDSERDEFFSFEGPIVVAGEEKEWWVPNDSRPMFSISAEKSLGSNKALRFSADAKLAERATIFAPFGSTKLESGAHALSVKVWLAPNSAVRRFHVILQDPWLQLRPFDLTGVAPGKWITLTQKFQRPTASGPKDRIRIVVEPNDTEDGSSTFYLDQLTIKKR